MESPQRVPPAEMLAQSWPSVSRRSYFLSATSLWHSRDFSAPLHSEPHCSWMFSILDSTILIQGLMVMNTEKVWQLSGHLWVPPSREGKGTSTTSELKTSKLNHNCMHHAGDAGNPGNSSSRFGIPSSGERGSKQTTSQWHVPMLVMLYMQGHPLLNTQWLGTQKRRKFIRPFLDPAIR